MEIPPKIHGEPAKEVPIEVLPPEPSKGSAGSPIEGPPIHALSALTLVAVDSLWAIFDMAPAVWLVAIPACFMAVFVPTFLIQKNLKHDSAARALTFATVLGILAAIPTPISGTPIGLGLLAWSGLGKLTGKSRP